MWAKCFNKTELKADDAPDAAKTVRGQFPVSKERERERGQRVLSLSRAVRRPGKREGGRDDTPDVFRASLSGRL